MNKVLIPKEHIIEYFKSFQGEGTFIGKQSLFIRFKRCNLKCSFCDTKLKMKYNSYPVDITLEQIVSDLLQLPSPYLIITGGEPLMYPTFIKKIIKEVTNFIPELKVSLETNGLLINEFLREMKTPDFISLDGSFPGIAPMTVIEFSFSPKFIEVPETVEQYKIILSELSKNEKKQFSIKFVDYTDLETLENFVNMLISIGFEKSQMYIMPEASNPIELLQKSGKTSENALELGINLTTRLQVIGLVP